MKKIAVFFRKPGAKDYPFTKKGYLEAYQELDKQIRKRGAELYITRDNSTYLGNGKFTKSWQFKENKIVETGEITADHIYDKGEFQSDEKVPVLNNKFINEVCTDKWKTYQLFKDFCPVTFLVQNENELTEALKNIPSDKKVIKPLDGEEGRGVFIGNDTYIKSCEYKFPLLAQEFLDTSSGIPNVYIGMHDLRVVFMNGEIIYAFYRTPPEGALIANLAQGGSLKVIAKKDIPAEIFEITKIIQKNFKNDYCFGVDIGFVNGKPKIIELNSRVALFSPKRGEEFQMFIEKLAELLTK